MSGVEKPVLLHSDRVLFQQAIENLIEDALELGGGRPSVIRVDAVRAFSDFHIIVRDDGKGLVTEMHDVALSRFGPAVPGKGSGLRTRTNKVLASETAHPPVSRHRTKELSETIMLPVSDRRSGSSQAVAQMDMVAAFVQASRPVTLDGGTMEKRKEVSLWDASATEPDHAAPLETDGLVDVAIIGGGYTGLSTALHAAEAGLAAHVIEAERIGYGGSGRNVGLVNAAAWLPPQEVVKALGQTYGTRFVKVFSQAPAYVFDLIEKHQIRCEATRAGTIHAAHGPSGFEDLRMRHAEWQRLGEPVDLLSADEVRHMTGTAAFAGGLLDHRAGTINPMGYCRGLARAARAAGAKISTGARATKLNRDGAHWQVKTDTGTLQAKAVVIGTNAYTDALWPGLKDIFSMIHYFQFATKPLGSHADHILPGRQGLWDTGQIMFNIRRDAQDRLLVGSMGKVVGSPDRGVSQRFARRQIARLFPDLGPVQFEQAWHGQIAMTADHLPKIYRLDEDLFAPIGYNGRGITTGTIFGKAMAEVLTGAPLDSLPLPVSSVPKLDPGAGLRSRLYQMAFTANQMIKAI